MPAEETIRSASEQARRAAAASATAAPPSLPESLRGRLVAAAALRPEPLPEVEETDAFVPANVVFRNLTDWKGLRTNTEFLETAASDLRSVRSLGAAQEAASRLQARLMSTGAYNSVRVGVEPTADSRGRNVIVELDEGSFSLSTGVSATSAGRVAGGTVGSLKNLFGNAETLSVTFGATAPETHAETVFERGPLQQMVGGGGAEAAGASRKAEALHFAPNFVAELRKPTLFGAWTPLSLSVRREVESHELTSGFAADTREFVARVAHPRGLQTLAYTLSWRQAVPVRAAGRPLTTLSSPEIVSECGASLKSSLTYTYDNPSRMNEGRGGPPANGHATRFSLELAGLGGDVSFVKSLFSATYAGSLRRFAPDTGYALPPTAAEAAARASKAASAAAATAAAAAGGHDYAAVVAGLLPHPGPAGVLGSRSASGLARTLAGWLSPGVTGLLDVSLGGLWPLGRDAQRLAGPSGSARVQDRFFSSRSTVRGLEAVGPRGTPVPGGSEKGDALGGDCIAAATVRLQLPPPLPSVRLANMGMRMQLWASAGVVGPRSALSSQDAALKALSASAGVGLTVPLAANMSLEANWPLWAHQQRGDVLLKWSLNLSE